MIHIRSANGLGDALHLRAAVLHLLKQREPVTVYTRWAALFTDLAVAVRPIGSAENVPGMRHLAWALSRPLEDGMSKFDGMCQFAGLSGVDLRIDWPVRNRALVASVLQRAACRPVLVFQPPRIARTDEQQLMAPRLDAMAGYLGGPARDSFRVKVGHPDYVNADDRLPCDLDLVGRLSVTDAIDIGAAAGSFFCEPCYLMILAEALRKPAVCMFSARALRSETRTKNMTPHRIIHRPECVRPIFDEEECAA